MPTDGGDVDSEIACFEGGTGSGIQRRSDSERWVGMWDVDARELLGQRGGAIRFAWGRSPPAPALRPHRSASAPSPRACAPLGPRLPGERDRRAVAVEPRSCVAFNTQRHPSSRPVVSPSACGTPPPPNRFNSSSLMRGMESSVTASSCGMPTFAFRVGWAGNEGTYISKLGGTNN